MNGWRTFEYLVLHVLVDVDASGSVSSAALRSEATSTASRRGDVAGIEPAMRSLVQMNSAPCATSISARNATRPTAMRQ